ncbi:hypothetical protein CLIB1423_07S03532 [[Candida] railenensis]|uniref:Pal1 cell morphology protein n=1 Tax=[Candida] railenensis TaxID=45579 RepID=A0A9P0VYJ4_9ASCO|nr:hypothetical protein CLIB1423_07S03532 [[Candida] railenensis]
MSSNNPFASAMNDSDSYVHHREPPPPPGNSNGSTTNRSRTQTPPSRPPKVAPPSYEEAAGPEVSRSEYPREKGSGVRVSTSSRESSNNNNNTTSNGTHTSNRSGNREHSSREHGSRDERPRRTRSANEHVSSRHHSSSHRSSGDREKDKERERERRRRKSPSKKTPQPVKSKNLDTIDKLDVTAFFGGGFHHDGPFDACTPHRNKNVKAAPVMAFPADGPNNSIKGTANKDKHSHIDLAFGNSDLDQNEIVGRSASRSKGRSSVSGAGGARSGSTSNGGAASTGENGENPAFKIDDPTSSLYIPKQNPSVINFDANQVAVPVHGEFTPGLGTSTFLDGAPAPKAVVHDEYLNPPNALGGGLGRKKSLAQRLRKNSGSENTSRRASNDNQIEHTYSDDPIEPSGNSLLRRVKSLKVGRK